VTDTDPGAAERQQISVDVLIAAMDTLKAGFVIVDEQGRPIIGLDRSLGTLGFRDLDQKSLADLHSEAVDADGNPLREDDTPVADAIFRDVHLNDLVLGFPWEWAIGGRSVEPDPEVGPVRWVKLNSRRIEVDGRSGVLVTAVEVSRLRHAEERLRETARELRASERRYRDIVENTADGIWVVDAEDRTTFVNAQMARILGRTPHEMLGIPLHDFVVPELRQVVRQRLVERRQGGHFHGEVRYLAGDGREVTGRISAAPLNAEDGTYAGSIAIVTDVTEELASRRVLEEAVAAAQRRFRLVFRHIADVITVFDVQGRVKFATPSAERVLGFRDRFQPEGGVLGLVHPDDRATAADAMAGVVDGTRDPDEPLVMRVKTAWGEWRYLECLAVNLLDEPAIEGIMVTARDMTERHQVNLALEHAARHDHLTELPNRAVFTSHLREVLVRYADGERSAALCYIDLDGFKLVNDEYGHAVGDEVLAALAHRVRESLRPGDMACRLGGDEFGLVLEDVTPEAAYRVAHRIWAYLDQPYDLAGGSVRCSASIGIAMAEPGDTPASWLERADAALYRAKRENPP
jgi:diguanylate cyclase (GGDEF)-like protein/PAS domain S-box-containing protein